MKKNRNTNNGNSEISSVNSSNASTSNSQGNNNLNELDARDLPSTSTSGYETTSPHGSSFSDNPAENGATAFTNIAACDGRNCNINNSLEDDVLASEIPNPECIFFISRNDLSIIEQENGIELRRYIKYPSDVNANEVPIIFHENCPEEQKTKLLLIIKEFLRNKWIELFSKTVTHLSATAILTSFGFWSTSGLIPRIIGAASISISGFLNYYLDDNNGFTKERDQKFISRLRVFEKLLNIIFTGATAVETMAFNFNNLSEEQQNEFAENALVIFSNKIFLNHISMYFTFEQILAVFHHISSMINIFFKKDNCLTKFYNVSSSSIRTALVITGFSILSLNVFNEDITTQNDVQKYLILAGIQSACAGAYISFYNIFTNICKNICNMCLGNKK